MEYLYNGQYGVSTGGNGLYYMRARYYNQDIKRFINRDILSGNIGNSQSLNRYCYVQGNPVSLTDPVGLCPTREEVYKNRALKWLHIALDAGGFLWDGFDVVNVLLYHFEGRDTEAAITLLCLIPGIANFLTLPIRLTVNLGSNAGEALIKLGKKYLPDLMENGSRFLNWAGGKIDDVWRWIQKKLGKAGIEDGGKIISYTDYDNIYRNSIHNPNAEKVMLGKYDGGGPTSYITKAGNDYTYFSIDNWDNIKAEYGFTDEDMFKLFNESFLDDGINQGKIFQYSHNPIGDSGALGADYKYLEQNGYIWNPLTMTMRPE